jgi:hypothetical protein
MKKVLISAYVPPDATGNPSELSLLRHHIGDLFHTVMEVSDDGSLNITTDHSGPVHELLVSVSGVTGLHIESLKTLVCRKCRFNVDTSQISLPASWRIDCHREDNCEALKLAFDKRTKHIYIVSVREDHEAMNALQVKDKQGKSAFVSLAESLAGVMASPTADTQ